MRCDVSGSADLVSPVRMRRYGRGPLTEWRRKATPASVGADYVDRVVRAAGAGDSPAVVDGEGAGDAGIVTSGVGQLEPTAHGLAGCAGRCGARGSGAG